MTLILYDHFEVEKSDVEDAKSYLVLDSRADLDHVFRPLLLQWSRLHTAGLQAFLRLWKSTGAQTDDFEKVEDLVRILIDHVVGRAPRTKDIRAVEEELAETDHHKLRELQMDLLELTYESVWGHHLRYVWLEVSPGRVLFGWDLIVWTDRQVREELKHEAFQFIREQRIRCLLRGQWFPRSVEFRSDHGPVTKQDLNRPSPSLWRYVRLSHSRRHLHYGDFDLRGDDELGLEMLPEKSMSMS